MTTKSNDGLSIPRYPPHEKRVSEYTDSAHPEEKEKMTPMDIISVRSVSSNGNGNGNGNNRNTKNGNNRNNGKIAEHGKLGGKNDDNNSSVTKLKSGSSLTTLSLQVVKQSIKDYQSVEDIPPGNLPYVFLICTIVILSIVALILILIMTTDDRVDNSVTNNNDESVFTSTLMPQTDDT